MLRGLLVDISHGDAVQDEVTQWSSKALGGKDVDQKGGRACIGALPLFSLLPLPLLCATAAG